MKANTSRTLTRAHLRHVDLTDADLSWGRGEPDPGHVRTRARVKCAPSF